MEGRGSGDKLRFLSTPLERVDIPIRVYNWAKKKGMTRLRELASWHPQELIEERNIGATSVDEVRRLIESQAEMSWEALSEVLQQSPETSSLSVNGSASNPEDRERPPEPPEVWDEIFDWLTPVEAEIPLNVLTLPTRMWNFIEARDLKTLGDLFAISFKELISTKNIGLGSVSKTINVARTYLNQFDQEAQPPSIEEYRDFLDLWRQQVRRLEPIHQMVLEQRSGSAGFQRTLDQIGQTLGVTKEWTRQIELRSLRCLKREGWWIEAVEKRLRDNLQNGVGAFEVLRQDPFLAPLIEREGLLRFFVRRCLEGRLKVADFSDDMLLVDASLPDVEFAWNELVRAVRRLTFPVPESEVHQLALRYSIPENTVVSELLWNRLRRQIHIIEHEQGAMVAGIRDTRAARLISYVSASPEPVPVAELQEKFGRGQMPPELIYVNRGVVALPHHVPGFYRWSSRIVPLCIQIMNREDAIRQWTSFELLDELQDVARLPDWLGHWVLASMLRLSGEVKYLGRARVALHNESEETERFYFHTLAKEVLTHAGKPLDKDAISKEIERKASMCEQTLLQFLCRPPFVQVSSDVFGLISRDLPGGVEAQIRACQEIVDALEQRQKGMSLIELTRFVHSLGGDFEKWTPEMVRSVARGDDNLQLNRVGSTGLAIWDDLRVPNRLDILRACIDEDGGTTTIEKVLQRMEATVGDRPSRQYLGSLCALAGVRIRGQELVALRLIAPNPLSATLPEGVPDASQIEDLPPEAVPIFNEFLAERPGTFEGLRREVRSRLGILTAAAEADGLVDLHEARQLCDTCLRLIDRADTDPSSPSRRLTWAAVRYFVFEDEAQTDLMVGGLDDDRAVLEAVAAYLSADASGPGC